MVGPFGGIAAASFVRAIEQQPDRHGEPLALTVNFPCPLTEGEFDISLRPVRTNRTNQHWVLELGQDGEPRTTATAVFGVRRDTWSDTQSRHDGHAWAARRAGRRTAQGHRVGGQLRNALCRRDTASFPVRPSAHRRRARCGCGTGCRARWTFRG